MPSLRVSGMYAQLPQLVLEPPPCVKLDLQCRSRFTLITCSIAGSLTYWTALYLMHTGLRDVELIVACQREFTLVLEQPLELQTDTPDLVKADGVPKPQVCRIECDTPCSIILVLDVAKGVP